MTIIVFSSHMFVTNYISWELINASCSFCPCLQSVETIGIYKAAKKSAVSIRHAELTDLRLFYYVEYVLYAKIQNTYQNYYLVSHKISCATACQNCFKIF